MFCKQCGTQLDDKALFCMQCGAKTDNAQQPVQQPTQPVYQQPGQPVYQQISPKSKMAAGLLGIFLGAFGIHNFYIGKTGRGVVQLVLTVLCCTAFISAVWGLIEGIMILCGSGTDGDNLPILND